MAQDPMAGKTDKDLNLAIENMDTAGKYIQDNVNHIHGSSDDEKKRKLNRAMRKWLEYTDEVKALCKALKTTEEEQRKDLSFKKSVGGVGVNYSKLDLFGPVYLEPGKLFDPNADLNAAKAESFGDSLDEQSSQYYALGLTSNGYYGQQQQLSVPIQPVGYMYNYGANTNTNDNVWNEPGLAVIGVPMLLIGLCLIGIFCLILVSFGGVFAYRAGTDAGKKRKRIKYGIQYKQFTKDSGHRMYDHLDEVYVIIYILQFAKDTITCN